MRERRHERRRERLERARERGDHQRHGRERDADASRRALLEAAEHIFARDGFEGARVDEIARVAGYNKSLIFQYFDDKEGLYRQVVWRHRDEAGAQLGALVERYTSTDIPLTAETVRDFLVSCVRWTFDFFQAHPDILRIHAWEAAEGWHTFSTISGPDAEAAHLHGKEWASAIETYIRRAQQAGFVRPEVDPRLLIASVMTQAEHYLITIPRFERIFAGADLSSSQALAHAREQIVGLFCDGALVAQHTMDLGATEAAQTADRNGTAETKEMPR